VFVYLSNEMKIEWDEKIRTEKRRGMSSPCSRSKWEQYKKKWRWWW